MAMVRRILFHEYPLTTWLGAAQLETVYERKVAPLLDVLDTQFFHRVPRAAPRAYTTFLMPREVPNLQDVVSTVLPTDNDKRDLRIAVFNAAPYLDSYQPVSPPKNLVVIINQVESDLTAELAPEAVERRSPGWYPSTNPAISALVVVRPRVAIELVSDLLTDIYVANSAPFAHYVTTYVKAIGVRNLYEEKVKFVLQNCGSATDYGHIDGARYVSFAAVAGITGDRPSKARRIVELWESFLFDHLLLSRPKLDPAASSELLTREIRTRKRSSSSKSLGTRGRIWIPPQAAGGSLSYPNLLKLVQGRPKGPYFLLKLSREDSAGDLRPIFGGVKAGRLAVLPAREFFEERNEYLRRYIRTGRIECTKFYMTDDGQEA